MNLGRNALRAVAALGVAGAVTAGLFGAASSASAAPAHPAKPSVNCNWAGRGNGQQSWQSSFSGNGVNIRSGPSTGCTAVGAGYIGQTVTLYCGDGGDWYYIHDNQTGVNGWVSDQWLNFDPEDGPPICG